MTQDEKTMAGLMPLLGLFGLSIVSIILWAVKKDESQFINDCGKEYLNFFLSIMIYSLVAGILCIVVIGFILLIAIGVYSLIVGIMATIKGFQGEFYKYPLIIRLVK